MAELDIEKMLQEAADKLQVKPFKERLPALKQRIEKERGKTLDGGLNLIENKDNKIL